jgi:hypothetical protein
MDAAVLCQCAGIGPGAMASDVLYSVSISQEGELELFKTISDQTMQSVKSAIGTSMLALALGVCSFLHPVVLLILY